MRMIMLEDLKPGMILAEPVFGKFDLLYASSEEKLTEALISGLDRIDISYVFVQDEETESEKMGYNNDVSEDFTKARENYDEMLTLMGQIFNDFQFLDKKVLHQIQEPMDELIETVTNNTCMLLKLKKLFLKDEYTLTHSIHVSLLAAMIAKWNGLQKKDIYGIALAGLLHDLGKSKIPSSILNKPGKLELHELSVMKRHSEIGYEIARNQELFKQDVLRGIIEHHERLDGTGYPQGLKKDQIHPYAQIIAIADVYDAMTTERSYKNSESPFVAVTIIKDLSYKQHLHPGLVNRFLKNIYRLYIGSEVILNNGEVGEIIYINKFAPERPLLRVGNGFVDLYSSPDLSIKCFKTT